MCAISQYFQIKVLECKLLYSDSNCIEIICNQGSNKHYASIVSDYCLTPNRRQAIVWDNDGLVNWCIYASHGLSDLSPEGLIYLGKHCLPFWIASYDHRTRIWNHKLQTQHCKLYVFGDRSFLLMSQHCCRLGHQRIQWWSSSDSLY